MSNIHTNIVTFAELVAELINPIIPDADIKNEFIEQAYKEGLTPQAAARNWLAIPEEIQCATTNKRAMQAIRDLTKAINFEVNLSDDFNIGAFHLIEAITNNEQVNSICDEMTSYLLHNFKASHPLWAFLRSFKYLSVGDMHKAIKEYNQLAFDSENKSLTRFYWFEVGTAKEIIKGLMFNAQGSYRWTKQQLKSVIEGDDKTLEIGKIFKMRSDYSSKPVDIVITSESPYDNDVFWKFHF